MMRFLFLMVCAGILTPALAIAQEITPETCPICRLWDTYAKDIGLASVEIGPLEGGAVYLFSSTEYRVIQQLQKFAHERQSLALADEDAYHPRAGLKQGHIGSGNEVQLEISLSPHGFFAMLRSPNPVAARLIREEASQAVRNRAWVPF